MVKIGLEIVKKNPPKFLKNKKIGLLCNQASVNSKYEHAIDVFCNTKAFNLSALFSPQHGMFGDAQANMVKSEGFFDEDKDVYIHSLYGSHRKPTPEMLENIDVMVIDLSDVGARYYTYIWTMALCMMACEQQKKEVVVLDRPNPINANDIEGTVLDESFASFVGLKPLPIRHGMTIGEIAQYFVTEFYPKLEFNVVKMEGYKRNMYFDETGLPWIMPSPNIPTLHSALLYPGICLLEGTTLSEGRGTTKPFELIGAPFINSNLFASTLNSLKLPGLFFRPVHFKPTFDKFKDKTCGGVQIHIFDRKIIKPFYLGLSVLQVVCNLYPKVELWSKGPYEYERRKKPIDILCGTDKVRLLLEKQRPCSEIEKWYNKDIDKFKLVRKKYLLYK